MFGIPDTPDEAFTPREHGPLEEFGVPADNVHEYHAMRVTHGHCAGVPSLMLEIKFKFDADDGSDDHHIFALSPEMANWMALQLIEEVDRLKSCPIHGDGSGGDGGGDEPEHSDADYLPGDDELYFDPFLPRHDEDGQEFYKRGE